VDSFITFFAGQFLFLSDVSSSVQTFCSVCILLANFIFLVSILLALLVLIARKARERKDLSRKLNELVALAKTIPPKPLDTRIRGKQGRYNRALWREQRMVLEQLQKYNLPLPYKEEEYDPRIRPNMVIKMKTTNSTNTINNETEKDKNMRDKENMSVSSQEKEQKENDNKDKTEDANGIPKKKWKRRNTKEEELLYEIEPPTYKIYERRALDRDQSKNSQSSQERSSSSENDEKDKNNKTRPKSPSMKRSKETKPLNPTKDTDKDKTKRAVKSKSKSKSKRTSKSPSQSQPQS